MDAITFRQEIDRGWSEWQALLGRFSPEQTVLPGATGRWTLQDVIAHITWHEREMADLIESRTLAGSDLWLRPLDERNQTIYEQNRDRGLEAVQAESHEIHRRLISAAQTLADDELNDPARFAGMPPDWIPWKLVAENTYEHYAEHTPDVTAFFEQL